VNAMDATLLPFVVKETGRSTVSPAFAMTLDGTEMTAEVIEAALTAPQLDAPKYLSTAFHKYVPEKMV